MRPTKENLNNMIQSLDLYTDLENLRPVVQGIIGASAFLTIIKQQLQNAVEAEFKKSSGTELNQSQFVSALREAQVKIDDAGSSGKLAEHEIHIGEKVTKKMTELWEELPKKAPPAPKAR